MLIGGFYKVDLELANKTISNDNFNLLMDLNNNYSRKYYTNNGRTATIYALNNCKDIDKNKKVLLPDYLCLSVITAIEYSGFKFDFYKVNKNLQIDTDDLSSKINDDIGFIYLIHYFGVPQPTSVINCIKSLCNKHNILLIEDITQSLFSINSERLGIGDIIVGSTRKWFPITDGGILALKNELPFNDGKLANAYNESTYKELFISVIRDFYTENPTADKGYYLQLEKEANASRYTDLTAREMTEMSRRILFNSDIEFLTNTRQNNYKFLYDNLSSNENISILRNGCEFTSSNVPFGFAFTTSNRDKLYSYLVEHNIIPEIQWILPIEYYTPGKDAMFLSENNIMIQCDQRYGLKEMEYICTVINNFYN